jgi:hypothetical protein
MKIKKPDQKAFKLLTISGIQICYFSLYFGLVVLENSRNFAVLKLKR